ncbi:hypothetical protein MIC97_08640 [Aquamicrobium sp. NLF2-7]|uniref:hypothetical protein n=1 Tax=Aquamicrobium sp. NLF2-7 TaxID=2918753 RepID=UPI001EFA3A11|nr:hypothetical protein [Aquamicrobium sp. NLF2-7]MCG8271568.1 hypothetical protein [Aquamicrobium sp. NLF2-7]
MARAGADAALASDISSLGATVGNNSAAIQLEATARANADSALAADIATLDAKVFDPDTGLPSVASAVDALSTYAGPDGALADAVTALSASSVPGDIAKANMRMGVMSGPIGYSRIAFETRYDGTGGYRGAAFGADTPADPGQKTRFWMRADQTVVMDSTGNVSAMFDGGSAYFNNARIRNLTAQNITADKIDAALILQNGSVIEDLIDVDTFSRFEPIVYSFTRTVSGGQTYDEGQWTLHGTVIVTKPVDKPCIEFMNVEAFASLSGSGNRDAFIIVKRGGNGTVASGEEVVRARMQGNGTVTDTKTIMRGGLLNETSIRYDIWTWNSCAAGGSSNATISVKCDSGVWVFR